MERDQGIDPQLEKRKQKEEAARERVAQRQAAYTLEDLVHEYIKEALKGQKRCAESARLLRQDLLPVLGHRPAVQIAPVADVGGLSRSAHREQCSAAARGLSRLNEVAEEALSPAPSQARR